MAASAYASLVSLLNTIRQIHTHPLVSNFFDIDQNIYLFQNVTFFVDFVEKYADAESKEVEDLMRRIADAAHKAEYEMEVHAADRVRGVESLSIFPDLPSIIREITEKVIKVKEEIEKSPSYSSDLPPPSSSAPPATDEATTMVGFDDYKHKLLDDLLGHHVDQQIISITGMGGIGKTTLARNLYENSLIVRHFNVRAWITVSQESSARKVYLQALSSLGGCSINMDTADDKLLSVELHRALFNRRYLIVLDDVWSVNIWDKIKFFFPENRNGSRIIVTTRESKLVDYIGSSALAVRFLNEENSWKLFCKKTFPQQDFPLELDDVGKKIVKKCGGLPLAISVIGGLLGKSPRAQEYWEQVVKDRNLVLNLGETTPLDILYLSYKYLHVCLKPCFLYLGSYPEDTLINVPRLIKLWIAEGFIKSKRDQSLEEVAESYISDLADRNLLLLHSSPTMRWKKCSTHDLIRDLCVKIGKEEKFFADQRSLKGGHYPLMVSSRERAAPCKTRLLRVLFQDERSRRQLGMDIFGEVNMRFLKDADYNLCFPLPLTLSQLWSLQTLIIITSKILDAPKEIWMMPQLRHIEITKLTLDDPPPSDDNVCVLQNLQTLRTVIDMRFTPEVCKRIPNIKQLDIQCYFNSKSDALRRYNLENLGCFDKLESLNYYCLVNECLGRSLRNMIKFPSSLKELTLNGSKLEWSYMAVIASLPHLEYLLLDRVAVAATEWIFDDERFVSLKYLFMSRCDVTKWTAQDFNFPVLETLSISNLSELDSIPSSIGEIPTLQSIHVYGGKESANISAVEILHEQQIFENLGLHVSIHFGYGSKGAALFREKIQELGFTCQNLVVEDCESYLTPTLIFRS